MDEGLHQGVAVVLVDASLVETVSRGCVPGREGKVVAKVGGGGKAEGGGGNKIIAAERIADE